jgi:hypothetical protein
MMEVEKMGSHRKGFLKLKCLSPLKMLTSPLFQETFGAFFSSVDDLGFLMMFKEKINSSKHFFSNGFIILAVDAYFWVELCMPTWLNQDYGDGGVVDILAVDAYSGVELCTPIFLGETSK